jgi:uncharacterized protein YuzE
MKSRYLEVTFRKGEPMAAYLYLPRPEGAKSARTETVAPGLLVDYGDDGSPIGIEITDPRRATVDAMNAILEQLGCAPLGPDELRPLEAA